MSHKAGKNIGKSPHFYRSHHTESALYFDP